VQGPLAAVVPIGGILVGAHLHRYLPVAGTVLTVASIVAAALFAGWILGFWMSGTVPVGAVHGAFLLPTAAAGFLAAGAAATVSFHLLAVGALSAGLLFWVVLFTVIVARLAFASPLPVPLVPTLAILVAPPAVAGSAWFAVNGAGTDLLSEGLLGILVLLLLVQLAFLPRYRSVPFSLGYWAFTFSYAAAGRYGMQWLALERPVGWQAFSVAILVAVTLFIATIGARSVVLVVSDRRRAQAAAHKAQLATAAAQEQPDAAA
jgi:tellurite resistance protein